MYKSRDINAALTGENNSSLDEEAALKLSNQIKKLWIEPEISRRKQTGTLPENFRMNQCLIRLPHDKNPIIEFNEEASLIGIAKVARGTVKERGDPIFIDEIEEVAEIRPPEVDGKRVPFIYLRLVGDRYKIFFDLSPSLLGGVITEEEGEWRLGDVIADFVHGILIERVIDSHDRAQALLQEIGLWVAPALLPYPLSKILSQLARDNAESARKTLIEYCTPEFIENLLSKWWAIKQLEERKGLIQEAFDAHKRGQYRLSIYSMLPQVEGIITDWIYTRLSEDEIPWRQESKTKKFRDVVLKRDSITYTYKRVVESAIDFTVEGPVLKTFEKWFDKIDDTFPSRHLLQHGKYDDSLFTNENSIKLFLLIDTIYHIISVQ